MNSILVSIIIPTYNDWERLSLCINALNDQTFSKDLFEVIIANNNPADEAPANFFLSQNCKIISEAAPGSYAARNAALRIAKGEIIGFTDSDCIPDKNWIKNAVDHFKNNKSCSRIAGKISIFFTSPNPKGAELYDKVYAFNQNTYVVNDGTSVTANLFTYKSLFEKVGFFDENLMSGGDFFWGMQAQKKGYKIDYVENVVVNHPARGTLKELIKKEKRVGGSQAIFFSPNKNIFHNVIKFIKELRPRIGTLKVINTNGKELSLNNKTYIFLLRHYLLIIRAYEKLRVQMGKKPNRA